MQSKTDGDLVEQTERKEAFAPSLNIHKYEVDLKYFTASETQMQKKVARLVAIRLLAGVEMLLD